MERSGGRRAGEDPPYSLAIRHPEPREGISEWLATILVLSKDVSKIDEAGLGYPRMTHRSTQPHPPIPQHEHRSSVHGSSFRILFPQRVRVIASLRHQGFPWIPGVPLPIFVTKIRGASRPGRRADSPVLPENLSRSRWQPARRMDLPRTGCHFEPVQLLFDLVKGVVPDFVAGAHRENGLPRRSQRCAMHCAVCGARAGARIGIRSFR